MLLNKLKTLILFIVLSISACSAKEKRNKDEILDTEKSTETQEKGLTESSMEASNSLTVDWSDEGELSVTIETPRLVALSISESHIEAVKKLYADENVMSKFGSGKPRDPQLTEERMKNSWIKRWKKGDPRGGFAVFEKSSNKLIGVVVSGGAEHTGESEIAYLLHVPFQGKGYGTEIVNALVKTYVPWMQKNAGDIFGGSSLKLLVATSSPDNPASWRILDKLGFVAYDDSLDVILDLRENDSTLEDSLSEIEDYEKFNMYDKNGILRTAEKRSKYGMIKWHFKLVLKDPL